jgi:TRAP-type mannitol/chloroaromatic compound transport system permease large subunit
MFTFQFLGEGHILTMLPQRMFSATTGFTLLAIPFFILAGNCEFRMAHHLL